MAESVEKFYAIFDFFRARSSAVSKWDVLSALKGRDCWSFVVVLILALSQQAQAYVTVSMNGLCKQREFTLRLSPSRPTSLVLDTIGSPSSSCKLEIVAPDTHAISLLYTRRKKSPERKKTESSFPVTQRTPQCILTVSFPLFSHDEEMKLRLDLCSEEAFITSDIDVLPSRITLEWKPMVKSLDDILVSEIVVAALGRGRDLCSQPGQLYCNPPKYPLYCISKELVCDGKRNCPEGSDEEEELCSSSGNREKSVIGRSRNDESTHIGQDWEFVASEVLKKLTAKDSGLLRKTDGTSTTERSMVLWSDDWNLGTGVDRVRGGYSDETNPRLLTRLAAEIFEFVSDDVDADESESLPDILKHYGPWGYLMLGMLICGTVLMFCGLWECCCRKPKSSSSSPAGPTLLIINQDAQQNDLETPQTPGPPRYEDLDQPPSYAALFPSSKSSDFQPNILPIMIPMVDSLSNLLTNSSSSQNVNHSAENTGHSTSSSGHDTEVYTIGLPRDESESNPK